MPMFVHILPSRLENNCKLLCVAAASGLQIYLEGKVSEVKQRVQAPYLVWTLPGGWLPHLWDSQLSHHIISIFLCPKVANHCHVFSPSRASQGLHTSNSFRQRYQISLLIDWHSFTIHRMKVVIQWKINSQQQKIKLSLNMDGGLAPTSAWPHSTSKATVEEVGEGQDSG